MSPDVRWITPQYGLGADDEYIGAPEGARRLLQEMADELVGTDGLVAVYVPEGTEDVYQPGGMRGRVAGLVRLVPMPEDRRMEDYFYNDWDGSPRWPIGWPCEVVYAPDESECPFLREHVESLFRSGSFGGYVSRFQRGPFRLEQAMRARLSSDFAAFTPLR